MSASANPARSQLAALMRIAGPLLVSNFANIGILVADTVLAGRLGASALAAVAVGSSVWMTIMLLGMGVLMSLGPVVAHHFGAGKLAAIGADARQGLWLAGVGSALSAVVCLNAAPLLTAIGIEPHIVILAEGYLLAISWGAPGLFLFTAIRQICEGIGAPRPIMLVLLGVLPINIALNIVFMYGLFGFPALGAIGCGLGSAVSYWLMFMAIMLLTDRAAEFRELAIWRFVEPPDMEALARLLRIGIPIGITLLMEAGLFGALTLLSGRFGSEVVAAHQIAVNYASLVFMGPLSFAMATTVTVGHALGAGDRQRARHQANTGVLLCVGFMLVTAAVALLIRPTIVGWYTGDGAVAVVAMELLVFATTMQPFDGAQIGLMGALRGYKDTRLPMVSAIAVYWGVGFTLAYALGIIAGWGITGVWTGIVAAIALQSCLMTLRLRRVSQVL
ncbi:MAG: MATE family efflux transporter [Gammaproteobacteria bacterium]|nr:MATE family efflux transporter [Gammaproteobacteria bacterium]